MKEMKLSDAIEEVLREDPKTKDNKYLWLFLIKVLQKLGVQAFIGFNKKLPSPDSMLTMRRAELIKIEGFQKKENNFKSNFIPEKGMSYSHPPNQNG